jgi:hypothetical protein
MTLPLWTTCKSDLPMLPTPMNIAHENTMWATNYKQTLPKSSGLSSCCCCGFVGNCCLFPIPIYTAPHSLPSPLLFTLHASLSLSLTIWSSPSQELSVQQTIACLCFDVFFVFFSLWICAFMYLNLLLSLTCICCSLEIERNNSGACKNIFKKFHPYVDL